MDGKNLISLTVILAMLILCAGVYAVDNDSDGFNDSVDCDDNNATIRPLYNDTHHNISTDILVCYGTYRTKISVVNSSVTLDGNGTILDGEDSTNPDMNIGIYLWENTSSIVVKNFNIKRFYVRGIYLPYLPSAMVTNNNITENGDEGIYAISSTNLVITNNYISGNPNGGIYFENSDSSNITDNVFGDNTDSSPNPGGSSCSFFGTDFEIGLYSSDDNIITDNTIQNSQDVGIYLLCSGSNTVSANDITSAEQGIYMKSNSTGNTIVNNNLYFTSLYNLVNNQSVNTPAENNYWGSINCSYINETIYDYYDDSSLGIVDWEPFLNSTYPGGSPTNCSGNGGGGGGGSAPSVYLVSPVNGTSTSDNTPTTTFYFTDDDNSTASCILYFNSTDYDINETTENNTNTDLTVNTSLAGGIYDWWVNCSDEASENQSEIWVMTIDITGPIITFEDPTPNNETISNDWLYVNVSSNENMFDVLLDWNGTNESMDGSGQNWYLTKGGLSNGNYTFIVYGNDSLNNTGVSETRWVYVNQSAPGGGVDPVVYLMFPPNETKQNDNTPNILFNFTDEDNGTWSATLYFNAMNVSYNGSVQNNTATWIESFELSDGLYDYWVNVSDGVGEGQSEIRVFEVDTTPPDDISDIEELIMDVTWIFWDWSYGVPSDFSHFEIWLDGTFKENKTSVTYNATGLTANTTYEIQVRPVDDVGNIGNWTNDTASTLEDTEEPTVTQISPVNGTITTSTTLTFKCTATDNYNVNTIQFIIDDNWNYSGTVTTTGNNVTNYTATFTQTLPVGSHYWYCNATDSFNNTARTPHNWTLTIEEEEAPPGGGGGGGMGYRNKTNKTETARLPKTNQTVNKTVVTGNGKVINMVREFSETGVIRVKVTVGDRVVVDVKKEKHEINVDKIDKKNKKVTMTVKSTPTEVTVNENENVKVDVDGDGVYDMGIGVTEIADGEATLIVEELGENEQTPTMFAVLLNNANIIGALLGFMLIAGVFYYYTKRK